MIPEIHNIHQAEYTHALQEIEDSVAHEISAIQEAVSEYIDQLRASINDPDLLAYLPLLAPPYNPYFNQILPSLRHCAQGFDERLSQLLDYLKNMSEESLRMKNEPILADQFASIFHHLLYKTTMRGHDPDHPYALHSDDISSLEQRLEYYNTLIGWTDEMLTPIKLQKRRDTQLSKALREIDPAEDFAVYVGPLGGQQKKYYIMLSDTRSEHSSLGASSFFSLQKVLIVHGEDHIQNALDGCFFKRNAKGSIIL